MSGESRQMGADEAAGRGGFAVRVPNWLGDGVLAVPAVRALASGSGGSGVIVLASGSSGEVFARVPGAVACVIATAGGGQVRSLKTAFAGAAILRAHRPDAVVSLTGSFTSALMCYLGGVPRRIGFADAAGGFLYSERVAHRRTAGRHLCDTFCEVVESAGVKVEDRVPRVVAALGDLEAGRRKIASVGLQPGGYVCLFPGARYGPSKRWGSERFALLGDAVVAKLGRDVAVVGGAEDRAACDAVRSAMEHPAADLAGRCGFPELVGIIAQSAGVVANDSGGMHLAAALGVPVVGLFFSTDPGWTGPVSPRAVALYNRAECSPCFRRHCSLGERCTGSIGVDEAVRALAALLEGPA